MDYYQYSRIGRATELTGRDRFIYRWLEILPGLLSWGTLAAIIVLSFTNPDWMAIFIIAFDIYWLIKTLYLSTHLQFSFRQLKRNLRVDWLKQLTELKTKNYKLKTVRSWQDIYHLVILPTSKEGIEVVTATLEGLLQSSYPKNRMIVVLAQEERAGKIADEVAAVVKQKYGQSFFELLIARHPDNVPGELAGKGSNAVHAIKEAKEKIIDRLGIKYDHIIVSNFDIDTIAAPQYFALLTYRFLTAEKPLRSAFQPVPLYTNNIWEAPAFARVFAFSTTFWQMIQQARPEQLVTFSSQSISFQALVDVGYWQVNMVSEDSRIFWQCYLRYNGDWRTVPIHYPVYMDANVASTFLQTIKNQYKQIRRWLYGAENNPYFMFGFRQNKKISWREKVYHTFTTMEKTHSSATNAIIIFLLGWLPLAVGGEVFNRSVLSFNLPGLTRNIMLLAMFGLISSAIISVNLLPPRPVNYGRWKWVLMLLQWLLFPINFIFFGAVPALDAQTRLMLGKYMGFWVTPKVRRNSPQAS
ncbi:MAG TPA: glycosyltransferase family 2 protein [Candidatus Paceibacterota bacterium]|nr:glycosyltransferase family 2 protein [Candidatus Paceibacterota bacterium]